MSDALAAIKKLYFGTTKATIARDFDTAIDLLKSMSSEDERERAAVYMDGLAQMRSQWAATAPRASVGQRVATALGRSGRSKRGGRRSRSGD
jgi:outer membrane PBP1 activator LpoA protein